MPKIPVVSGKQAIKAFQKVGYVVMRQKGSHIRLIHPAEKNRRPLTIPDHKEVSIGVIRRLLRDSGISVEQFILLNK